MSLICKDPAKQFCCESSSANAAAGIIHRPTTITLRCRGKLFVSTHNAPLYQSIVLKAREMDLAGGTVLRGAKGFGKSSRLHTGKMLRLWMDLPIVIGTVDAEEKVQEFLPVLYGMFGGGLVTWKNVRYLPYRSGKPKTTLITQHEPGGIHPKYKESLPALAQ